MPPDRLKHFVSAAGGAGPFASLLRVTPRIVYYWLSGAVPFTPSRADQINWLAHERGWLA